MGGENEQRQKYRGRCIFFFFFPMRGTVGIRASQIRGVILTGFDVLCHVSVMMADMCLCMFACHIFLPSFFFFFYLLESPLFLCTGSFLSVLHPPFPLIYSAFLKLPSFVSFYKIPHLITL